MQDAFKINAFISVETMLNSDPNYNLLFSDIEM